MRLAIAILAAFIIIAAGCTGAPQQGGQASGQQAGGASGGAASGGTQSGSGISGGDRMGLDECVVNCNVLEEEGMIKTCQSGCYMDAAEESKDASKCDPIATMGKNMSIYYATCLGNL